MANNQNFKVKNGLEVGLGADIGSTLNVGSNIYTKGDLIFEGATDDAFELTLSVTDPTADRTIILPDSDGTFVLATGDTTTSVQSELNLSLTVDATGVLTITGDAQGLATTDSPTFAGLTIDGTSFGLINNSTGSLTIQSNNLVLAGAGGATTYANFVEGGAAFLRYNDINRFETTATGAAVTGNLVANGLTLNGNTIVLEGATANTFETTLNVVDPTADRTINIPNNSGTIAVAANGTTTTTQGDLNTTVSISATGVVTVSGDAHGLATTDSPTFQGLSINGSIILDSDSNISRDSAGALVTVESISTTQITMNGDANNNPTSFPYTLRGVYSRTSANITSSANLNGKDIYQADADQTSAGWIVGEPVEFVAANTNKTVLRAEAPTADRVITFPDASGTVAFTSGSDVLTISNGTTSTTLQTADTLTIAGGTYLTSSVSGDTVTIAHDSTTRTDTTSTESPAVGGTVDVVSSVTTNATGHVTAIDVKTVTLPSDADTLDGIDSTSFLRSDTADTMSALLTIEKATGSPITSAGTEMLRLQDTSATGNPWMSFYQSGTRVAYIQYVDSGEYLRLNNNFNGTSVDIKSGTSGLKYNNVGTEYTVWHSGNDGSGSGLDADTLDGLDSTDFVRSTGNVNQNINGNKTFNSTTVFKGSLRIGSISSSQSILFNNGANTTLDLTSGNFFVRDGAITRFTFGRTTGNFTATGGITVGGNLLPGAGTPTSQNIGSASNQWNTVYAQTFEGTATNAQYADLAEKYLADDVYGPGTVIAVGGDAEVTAAHDEIAHSVLGVVSTAPAFLMNKDLEHGTVIALKGRVPVKCIGTVRKGDRLAPSHFAGYATVDNSRTAWSFAIALEDGADDLIEAVIL